MKKNIIIGSRGSILALAQANLVKEKLEENYPNLSFEIKVPQHCFKALTHATEITT